MDEEEQISAKEHANNFFVILTMAIQYGEGNTDSIKMLEPFIKRNRVRFRNDIRMYENSSQRAINIIRKMIKTLKEAEKEEKRRQQENTMSVQNTPKVAADVVTPEDASKIDGSIIQEVPAEKAAAEKAPAAEDTAQPSVETTEVAAKADIDLGQLYKDRETDRTTDSIDGKKILPGNLHDEMMRNLDSSALEEAELSDKEAQELAGLYDNLEE